eukprot:GHVT01006099.1.p2 GENE.GHVT01006099.1~~GHVT01006099.1.p2  ORF type:complete len:155 (+),score=36.01 GHVT01006099.1:1457-1921(+)
MQEDGISTVIHFKLLPVANGTLVAELMPEGDSGFPSTKVTSHVSCDSSGSSSSSSSCANSNPVGGLSPYHSQQPCGHFFYPAAASSAQCISMVINEMPCGAQWFAYDARGQLVFLQTIRINPKGELERTVNSYNGGDESGEYESTFIIRETKVN